MFTNASKNAMRAVLYLALHSNENEKIGVKKIAKDLDTPQPFLAKLLQKLSRNNLISSTKGPTGGFFLDDKNLERSLWDVIKCIDDADKFDRCFLGLSQCDDKNPCPVHFTVASFKKKILNDFEDKSIKELAAEIKRKNRHIIYDGQRHEG